MHRSGGKASGGSILGYLDSRPLRVPSGYFGLTPQMLVSYYGADIVSSPKLVIPSLIVIFFSRSLFLLRPCFLHVCRKRCVVEEINSGYSFCRAF